ncbi:MAG: hypothetical protein ACHQFX_14725 [Chitinophagales bacterium]
MKKLLSIGCFYMYMHSIAQSPIVVSTPKTSGEKVLVKALTALVNREGNKKTPLRKLNLSTFEYP